ncbi:hypothetical protein CASFOL_042723 [Castilleja foliolosa]|uniref:Uncharacterized protein n=1 Tax=Castilleja foliolosa TaxID=1961234 RepID=A0ABD3B7W7_9LAMI
MAANNATPMMNQNHQYVGVISGYVQPGYALVNSHYWVPAAFYYYLPYNPHNNPFNHHNQLPETSYSGADQYMHSDDSWILDNNLQHLITPCDDSWILNARE